MTEATPLPTDDATRQPPTSASATTRLNTTAVVSAASPAVPFKYYHQYCFHLSPTFNRFCPMRVRDLLRLDQFDAFEGRLVLCPFMACCVGSRIQLNTWLGQNIFFHMNHPIKWVRVSGVVVNFADYYGRHVYTIDDGTGMSIECVMPAVRPPPEKRGAKSQAAAAGQTAGASISGTMTAVDLAADRLRQRDQQKKADDLVKDKLGKVIEARGDLCLYQTQHRGSFLQVQISKLKVLRGTQQEVEFWHKVNTFTRETLDKPWVVDKQVVRECRKAAHEYKEEAERNKPKHSAAPAKASSTIQAVSQTADPTPLPPPRRPRKRWQLRPNTPDGGDVEDMHNEREPSYDAVEPSYDAVEHKPEPMELDDQPPRREPSPRRYRAPLNSMGPLRCNDVNKMDVNAGRSPPRTRRKKWNIK
ncbi:ob-fold nucleic acid binding domain-containing protein [Ophiostoma piceae UAMH 11346]|uniref:Ob-fold nucleic acid binding domain-containing protein n=1 Tax=Ophiostoma piceae (strain UAMH 11346) TaxID=1262450 RepID=S3CAL7_OPHP1|nr:ob-fold nucleic acid binding domain-containing protein [Ophiostoma piceae UAMH 11346]